MEQPEQVTATVGEIVATPMPYHSFRVGPYSVTTYVREGETSEAALRRAEAACLKVARAAYAEAWSFWSKTWKVER